MQSNRGRYKEVMRPFRVGSALAGIAALLLSACGGGGGGNSSGGGATNRSPTANGGAAQTVDSGATVTLSGSGTDTDGTISSYAWTQTVGTAVALSNAATAQTTFTAPTVSSATTLTFSLIVTDNRGASSAASTVNVTVNPLVSGNVNVTGKVRFERVSFLTTGFRPLDYAHPVLQPVRGVTVRALNAGTQAQIVAAVTDADGDYTLSVPSTTNVIIEVVARMQKTGAAPTWDVRVQDGVDGNSPFTHRTAAFGAASGVTKNIDIPTGISGTGTATLTSRPSGPFAILDTIYTAQQALVGVSPAIAFPALVVDWGSQADGTFFSSEGGQHIALLSDLTEDTDEFDQHVVAHEFGHYIEFNFSRADNIGGAHGLGDRLDPRVAFGEGFGYAFAAIVLDDPIARDSFFGDVTPNDGVSNPVHASGGFNVETNPATNPPGTGNDREGCWCSESSVWSILYDIYDAGADSNDTLSLGLQPIWNVLTGEQKNTPAFTTIFSFITALKTAQPGSITAINTLVAAQNIDAANIDAFATNETHFPSSGSPTVAPAAALPLFTTTTIGGAAKVLRNVNDAGNYNKLGNHRFVRFNVPSTRNVTISLATTNATDNDPDFLIFRAGDFIDSGEDPPPGPESHSFNLTAGDYVLDVYDCSNGCTSEQGTAGDYDLTLTIN